MRRRTPRPARGRRCRRRRGSRGGRRGTLCRDPSDIRVPRVATGPDYAVTVLACPDEGSTSMTSPHEAAPDRYDTMAYRRVGTSGLHLPAISLGLWQNFGDDRAARHPARNRAPGVRPRCHPLRPCQQLRPAARVGRDELRADRSGPICGAIATSWSSRPRPATTCGRDLTATMARASTFSPASTRASAGWVSTTSTSSIPTASIRTRVWKRRWVPSTAPSARARRSTWGSPRIRRSGRAMPRRSCEVSGRRCSSISRPTRC